MTSLELFFLPLNDSMPSIQAPKYVCEDTHSIRAPTTVNMYFNNYGNAIVLVSNTLKKISIY